LRTLKREKIYASDARKGFKVSFLDNIKQILIALEQLEDNMNYDYDYQENIEHLHDIITAFHSLFNNEKSGETK